MRTVEVFAAPSGGSGTKCWVSRGGSKVGCLDVSNAVRGGGCLRRFVRVVVERL